MNNTLVTINDNTGAKQKVLITQEVISEDFIKTKLVIDGASILTAVDPVLSMANTSLYRTIGIAMLSLQGANPDKFFQVVMTKY